MLLWIPVFTGMTFLSLITGKFTAGIFGVSFSQTISMPIVNIF